MGTNTTGEVSYYKPSSTEVGYEAAVAASQDRLDNVVTSVANGLKKRLTLGTGATPSVSGGGHFVTANTSLTNVTNFTGGTEGQIIIIEVADLRTIFKKSASLIPLGGLESHNAERGVFRFVCINDGGLKWIELPGATERKFSSEYVPLTRSAGISEWPSPSSSVWTTINLYNYGVPAGAARAVVLAVRVSTSNRPVLQARPTGTLPTEDPSIYYFATRNNNHYEAVIVPVSADSRVDVRQVYNVGGAAANGWVQGYFKR